jgi:hypothetical protein
MSPQRLSRSGLPPAHRSAEETGEARSNQRHARGLGHGAAAAAASSLLVLAPLAPSETPLGKRLKPTAVKTRPAAAGVDLVLMMVSVVLLPEAAVQN